MNRWNTRKGSNKYKHLLPEVLRLIEEGCSFVQIIERLSLDISLKTFQKAMNRNGIYSNKGSNYRRKKANALH